MKDNIKVYEPNERELIYLKNICKKMEGTTTKLPNDLKPRTKLEHTYEAIFNSIK